MKNIALALSLLFSLSIELSAQKRTGYACSGISWTYNWMSASENFGILWHNRIGKNGQALCGLRWHLNRIPTDDKSTAFSKRFKATELKQHFGLIAGYRYYLPARKIKARFFAETNIHWLATDLRAYDYISTGEYLNGIYPKYALISEVTGPPTTAFEYTNGLGGEFDITDRLSLMLRAGVGQLWLYVRDDYEVFGFSGTGWDHDPGYQFSGGLSYRLSEFGKPRKKK